MGKCRHATRGLVARGGGHPGQFVGESEAWPCILKNTDYQTWMPDPTETTIQYNGNLEKKKELRPTDKNPTILYPRSSGGASEDFAEASLTKKGREK